MVPTLVTLNDLEHVMAVILRYLTEVGSSRANYVTVVEVRAILSATKM